MKGNNDTVATQATSLNAYYSKLTAPEKKAVISAFFKNGGKKQGLSSLFSQYVECESGYANFRKVLKLKDVPIIAYATPPSAIVWNIGSDVANELS